MTDNPIIIAEKINRFRENQVPFGFQLVLYRSNRFLRVLMPGDKLTYDDVFSRGLKGYLVDLRPRSITIEITTPVGGESDFLSLEINIKYKVIDGKQAVETNLTDPEKLIEDFLKQALPTESQKFRLEEFPQLETYLEHHILSSNLEQYGLKFLQVDVQVNFSEGQKGQYERVIYRIKQDILSKIMQSETQLLRNQNLPLLSENQWRLLALQIAQNQKDAQEILTNLEPGQLQRLEEELKSLNEILNDLSSSPLIGSTSNRQYISRFTDISYPSKVWIKTPRLQLVIRLTEKPNEFSVKIEKLHIQHVENKPIRVRLQTNKFEVLNKDEQEFQFISGTDSEPLVFDLRPLIVGQHIITLDFFQSGNPVGTVSLPIEVTADEVSVNISGPPSQPLHFQTAIEPPERMLYISYDHFQEQPALSFTMFRAGEVGRTFRPVLLETELSSYADRLYERLTVLRESVDPTAKAIWRLRRVLPVEDVERRIRQFGQNLWRELVPQELKDLYASERVQWHDYTLLVVSDEPYLPWELLWPYGDGWEDPGPWCEMLLLTRWLRRDFQGNGHEAPANRLAFQSLACLAPTDSKLPKAQAERRFLDELAAEKGLKNMTPEPPSWAKVLDLLENGGYNWLHAATHGTFYPENPESDSAIWLQDGHAFTPQDVVGPRIESYIKTQRPAFVFNACHAGRQDWALTRLGGWANRLISTGAGLFLAPLWTVSDDRALEFSKALYTELFGGKTVAEAVRAARKAAKKQGDPTWLAYSVYAHPNARLTTS